MLGRSTSVKKDLCVSVRFLFFFLPLLLWVGLRIYSEQSKGIAAIELLCWLQLFIFFWVLSNHGRMRAQAKLLCAVPMGLLL